MRMIDIGIAMRDEDLARALAAALTRNVRWLTVDIVGKDDQGNHDVIITDLDEMSSGENVLFLSGSAGMTEGAGICKYGNVTAIADAAFDLVRSLNGAEKRADASPSDILRYDNDVSIYTFVSPYGGSGCTSCALGFAEAVTLTKDKRTLYISMSPAGAGIQSAAPPHGSENRNIRRLLYHLSEGRDMSKEIKRYTAETEKGVVYFYDHDGISPLSMANTGLLEVFLGTIVNSGLFDAAVIDAGDHFTAGLNAATALSEKIFVIYDGRRAADKRPRVPLARILAEAEEASVISVMNMSIEAELPPDSQEEERYDAVIPPVGEDLLLSRKFVSIMDKLCIDHA